MSETKENIELARTDFIDHSTKDRAELYDLDSVIFVEEMSEEDLFLTMIDIVELFNVEGNEQHLVMKIDNILQKLKQKVAKEQVIL